MSRARSIPPPSEAAQARASFTRASEILKPSAPPPGRKFPSAAADVRRLSEELAALLELGAGLRAIDDAAIALGRKCLAIQQETLVARGSRRLG